MWRELAWSDESEAHIAKHNVTPSEVEEVVSARPQWEYPGVDGSTLIYGRTDAGRPLLVASPRQRTDAGTSPPPET